MSETTPSRDGTTSGGAASKSSLSAAAAVFHPANFNEAMNSAPAEEEEIAVVDHDPDEDEEEEGERRRLLRLLNKITPTKFDRLCRQYLSATRLFDPPSDFEGSNEDDDNDAGDPRRKAMLRLVASAVAERAADDSRYGPTYARLCARLAEAEKEAEDQRRLAPSSPTESAASTQSSSSSSFRGELLDRLRWVLREPRRYVRDGEKEEMSCSTSWRRVVRKARCIGHARFCGELLAAEVVDAEEVKGMMDELLEGALNGVPRQKSGEEEANSPGKIPSDELKLEAFAAMLASSGARLETLESDLSVARDVFDLGSRSVVYYKERTLALLEDQYRGHVNMSVRMKFVLMDLMERAENGWEGRHGQRTVVTAMTLRQIRKEAIKVRPI